VGLERGPLSLVRTTELLGRKVAAPVYETEINDCGNPLRSPRDTLYPQNVGITSTTSGGRSVGRVLSRTKVTEFSFFFLPGLEYIHHSPASRRNRRKGNLVPGGYNWYIRGPWSRLLVIGFW
jgi:hypothetical protein